MLWAALCITANSGCQCPLWVKSRHSALRQKLALFDYLVGAREQSRGNNKPECVGRLQVDDELELGRQYDRKVGGLFSFENAASVNANQAKQICHARSVAHQAASLGKLSIAMNRGQRVARRQYC